MPVGWRVWSVAATVFVLVTPAFAQQQEERYHLTEADWPCHGRYRLEFDAGAYWRGPEDLQALQASANGTVDVRPLAEDLFAPQTGLEAGTPMIADFASALPVGPERNQRLALLFAAVMKEANLYRKFVLEGIVGLVARHRIAADELAKVEAEYARMASTGSATPDERKALADKRFWLQRAADGAEGDARFLCHRLNAMDGKLGALARTIEGHRTD